MDGCARQNPAYRPAKGKPRFGGAFLRVRSFATCGMLWMARLAEAGSTSTSGHRDSQLELIVLLAPALQPEILPARA